MKCEVKWVAEDGKEFENKLHCSIHEAFATHVEPSVAIIFDPGEDVDHDVAIFTYDDIVEIFRKNSEGLLSAMNGYNKMRTNLMNDAK